MFFVNIGPNSGQQRENGANQKIRQTWVSISLCFHLSLPKSTLPSLHTSTTRSTAHLTHAISSKHSTLSSVPSHWLCHFLHKQTSSISSQFSAPQMQELKPTTSIAKTPPLPSVPRSIQTSLLQLPYNMPSWSNPLTPSQIYISFTLTALTHIINTSLLTGTFPNAFKQARVSPLLKKPTLNTSLTDNYRPVSLSFHT